METLHPPGIKARVFGTLSYAVAPVIYSLAVPIAILDGWLTLYQRVCFTVYGIPQVPRGAYIQFDRGRLHHLRWFDRLNCNYCAYANGVLAYSREIAARTEQYWCPIKHARKPPAPHARYARFLPQDEVNALPERRQALREYLVRPND